MTMPPLAQNATAAQAKAYLQQEFGNVKYNNSSKTPYQGMTAVQIYDALAASNPNATPYEVATGAADEMLSSVVAYGIGQGANTGLSAIGASAKAVANPSNYPSNPITSLQGFLSALGSANLWIRVAKVIGGGVILFIGLAKLTGADQHVTGIASKAIKAAPLLA